MKTLGTIPRIAGGWESAFPLVNARNCSATAITPPRERRLCRGVAKPPSEPFAVLFPCWEGLPIDFPFSMPQPIASSQWQGRRSLFNASTQAIVAGVDPHSNQADDPMAPSKQYSSTRHLLPPPRSSTPLLIPSHSALPVLIKYRMWPRSLTPLFRSNSRRAYAMLSAL